MARIANEDRARFSKLRDADLLARLQSEFEACERAMPAADIVIDTERVSIEVGAGVIAARLSQLQS
jgi:predicted metal-dependent hydrolase